MNTPLQQAAQHLIDRWESDLWKNCDTPMIDLRKALEAEQAQAVEPVAIYDIGVNEKLGAVHLLQQLKSGDKLFTHPAPPAQQVAPYDQQALELCDACGWKAIMPGEPCFVCNMKTEAQQVAVPATSAAIKRFEPELYDEDRVRMDLDLDGDWVKYSDFLAQQVAVLTDIEQYRMQMAGISTAALGYWSEGDDIHPDYDTPALRDVARLYVKYDQLFKEKEERRAQQVAAPVREVCNRGNLCPWSEEGSDGRETCRRCGAKSQGSGQ